jgi:hypothetical protein
MWAFSLIGEFLAHGLSRFRTSESQKRVRAWMPSRRASLPAAKDGREEEGNDFSNDSVAAGLAYFSFHRIGGANYYDTISRVLNRLATSLLEHRVSGFIPEDGVDAKTESSQVAVVRRPKSVHRVRFDTHRDRIDILIVQERLDERMRA